MGRVAVEYGIERQGIAVGRPGQLVQPGIGRGSRRAKNFIGQRRDLFASQVNNVHPRLALVTDDLVVRGGDHGQAAAVRRHRQLMNIALVVHDLFRPERLQIEFPDLRVFFDAVAVCYVLEFLAQVLEGPGDGFAVRDVENRFAVAGEAEVGDALGSARDGDRFTAAAADAPHLRFAVVRSVLLVGALAVAGEVDGFAVRGPLRRAVVGAIEGEPPRGAAQLPHYPQVRLAVVGRLLPATLGECDMLRVRGIGNLKDIRLGEIIVQGDVVSPPGSRGLAA